MYSRRVVVLLYCRKPAERHNSVPSWNCSKVMSINVRQHLVRFRDSLIFCTAKLFAFDIEFYRSFYEVGGPNNTEHSTAS